MDEKMQENQETGFVLRDEPQPQAEEQMTTAEGVGQAEVAAEFVETQQETPQAEPQPQVNVQPQVEPQPQPQVQPQPMPSSDNLYRFQNIDAQKTQKEPKEKKESSIPKVLASAAIFGVVAAVCFFSVNALLSLMTGGKKGDVGDSSAGQIQSITTVSGAAVAGGYGDVSGIVERVMPSIVAITEKTTQTSLFGQTYSSEGAGSGFIVKQDGDQLLIVTNNHVVADADEISVQFNDGESVSAKVKGTSASNDLAVLTVEMKDLKDSTKEHIKVASLGSSDDAKVGQMVIAIGNALGYGQSVTVGYVSAKNREVSTSDGNTGQSTTMILLQTDAAINPGNSGGALIDTNGNVIGINSSKYMSYGNSTVEGMGYAIPMSDAVSIINDLMDREVLKDSEKGYLGITGRDIDSAVSESYGMPEGVYVVAVSDTGAAYKAGIKQGDIIVKLNDINVKSITEVQEIVNNTKAGTEITVTVKRSDDGEYKEKELKVTLKGKDTLDGLPEDSKEEENNSQDDYSQGYGYDNQNPYTNPYGGEEVVPWGGVY